MLRRLFVITALFGGSAFAYAQDDRKQENPNDTSITRVATPVENDRRIARWLIVDVRGAIDCSQLALEKSSNENVRRFAQTMLNEHKDCLTRLEQIKGTADSPPANGSKAPVSRIENTTINPGKSAVLTKDEGGKQRDGKLIYREADFVAVKEKICERMKEVMMSEFKQIPASEFDAVYMKHMVAGHEAMIASCQAISGYASADFKASIDQNIAKAKEHLKQARLLSSQLTAQR
jgi:predicted outer membrane protein